MALLLLLFDDARPAARRPRGVAASRAPEEPRSELARPASTRASGGAERNASLGASAGTSQADDEALAGHGGIAGRLTIDGQPPELGGRVLHGEDGIRVSGGCALDPEGRFRFDGLRPGTRVLSFSLASGPERRWCLPRLPVACAPGRTTELVLDWRTRHVNLKVIGDPGGWNRARVRLDGASTTAEFETDDAGRARLTLLEGGSFRLSARHASGWSGSALLELAEDADLESVVIRLVAGRGPGTE